MSSRGCKIFNLSEKCVDYPKVWLYQKALVELCNEQRKCMKPTLDSLLLLQHNPVVTLGRGADLSNLKFAPGQNGEPPVYRVERGGDVTWHGPGQLMLYPIIDLNCHRRDLHWYVRTIEQTVIDVLREYGISGERHTVNSGVFLHKNKVSAVGITASRWITMHGVSLNLTCDMKNFDKIVPCGIHNPEFGVCRLQDAVSFPISVPHLSMQLVNSFKTNFNLTVHDETDPMAFLDSLVSRYPTEDKLHPVTS